MIWRRFASLTRVHRAGAGVSCQRFIRTGVLGFRRTAGRSVHPGHFAPDRFSVLRFGRVRVVARDRHRHDCLAHERVERHCHGDNRAAAYGFARVLAAVALGATLWFAFTGNVWSHAARAEAQDLATMCSALAIYAFLRWMRSGGDRWFIGAFAACGLGMAAHPNALWVIPGL